MAEDNVRRRLSARAVVHQELRRRIVTLELPPGSPLSENDLAGALQVSRTPVRESLILLAEEDLVQVFPQLGTFVARVDPARVRDAQFIREAVELASLADAVELADPAGIAGLRDILTAQHAHEGDVEEFFRLDERFHQELLAIGGHASAWRTVHSAKAHLDRARRLGLRAVSPVADLIDQHTQVVDALERGDLAATTAALRDHLRAVFADIERIREQSPELFVAQDADERPVRRTVAMWR
ncbi:MAG TPA: GntR family transcriptional regulator [Pseudonocardiaceae bacterium]|nr:GntR family transcriptional regulator [Pseudonocardiaceae bacterium]